MTTPVHPDDELLSASLDAEADVDAHLRICMPCRTRYDALRSVASTVATPVPPAPPWRRDAAVRAAVEAFAPTPETAGYAPLHPAEHADHDRVAPIRRRRSPLAWLAPVAALIVGVALAAPLLTRSEPQSTDGEALLQSDAERTEDVGAGFDVESAPAGPPGRDLGDHSDPATLQALLAETMRAGAPEATGDAAIAPASGEAGGGARQGATGAPTSRAVPGACAPQAQAASDRVLGPPDFAAFLRWNREPAEVVVFTPEGSPAEFYVMALAGCRVLYSAPL